MSNYSSETVERIALRLSEQARALASLYRISEAEAQELLVEGLKGEAKPISIVRPK